CARSGSSSWAYAMDYW
nr:immunoglobulin heavy chain junction region [Mus musculus]